MEICSDFFHVREDLIVSTLFDLCETQLGGSLACKLRDNQEMLIIALVLLAPLLALGSKSTSLRAGIHV